MLEELGAPGALRVAPTKSHCEIKTMWPNAFFNDFLISCVRHICFKNFVEATLESPPLVESRLGIIRLSGLLFPPPLFSQYIAFLVRGYMFYRF